MQTKQKYRIMFYNSDYELELSDKYIVSNTVERAAKKAFRQSKKSYEIILMDSSGRIFYFDTTKFSFSHKEARKRKLDFLEDE